MGSGKVVCCRRASSYSVGNKYTVTTVSSIASQDQVGVCSLNGNTNMRLNGLSLRAFKVVRRQARRK